MKPDTRIAMQQLITEIRSVIPFDIPMERMCNGPCTGCSKKLLEYLETELEGWERSLAAGIKPGLGDLNKLGKTARKIQGVLARNQLID